MSMRFLVQDFPQLENDLNRIVKNSSRLMDLSAKFPERFEESMRMRLSIILNYPMVDEDKNFVIMNIASYRAGGINLMANLTTNAGHGQSWGIVINQRTLASKQLDDRLSGDERCDGPWVSRSIANDLVSGKASDRASIEKIIQAIAIHSDLYIKEVEALLKRHLIQQRSEQGQSYVESIKLLSRDIGKDMGFLSSQKKRP